MTYSPIVIFLLGPTAIGKSKLALKIKEKFSIFEIISVDSQLVYKDLNIGTDKPDDNILKKFKHRLINIREIYESYSVSEFYNDAFREIFKIFKQGKIPLLVGGSMFYFKVLLCGLIDSPPANRSIQNFIFKEFCNNNKDIAYNLLKKIDNIIVKKIHKNDIQRVIRALEIYYVSGKKLSELIALRKNINRFPCNVFQFGLYSDNKDILLKKIKLRFYNMLENGLEKEAKNIKDRYGYYKNYSSLNCIGYKYMFKYLQGECLYDEMIQKSISSTCNLMKHQLTWMRSWKNLTYININSLNSFFSKINNIIINRR